MNGTPRQIAWAMRIRIRRLPALKWIADMFQHVNPETERKVRDLATRAIKEQDSTFWIAHRNDPVDILLRDQESRMVGYDPQLRRTAVEEAQVILGTRKPSESNG
jgi:hypothetical protein